eukprot:CAMPEP_0177637074 /NCGR_PEP_ID=MMETSP0447-20121125/4778_1 /TAXON_ID=0 /ORGANISM="Stygamoeba regulata, Strain BSH-02190019" /LENGTH=1732 /DNA_ID=CAMNT_0019138979 /DNA_START=143 /DNA_END=5342 /DNA_ORIENTATION=+
MGGNYSQFLAEAKERDGKEFVMDGVRVRPKEAANLLKTLHQELQGMTHLEINNARIKHLPVEIKIFFSLLVLRLRQNRLASLPDEVAKLKLLRELDLSENSFSEFPVILLKVQGLNSLTLAHNHLAALPPLADSLRRLEHVDLSHNEFSVFPSSLLSLGGSLRSLDLSSNRIQHLPGDLAPFTRLNVLSLSNNRFTEILPGSFSTLTSLRQLDLSENQLRQLPAEVGLLTNLTNLSLQHNKLRSLPAEIGSLSSLVVLKLHDNELSRLPPELGELSRLTELFLQENQLVELPSEIGRLSHLRKLYAEYNLLEALPAEIVNLRMLVVLILHHNALSQVPPALREMTNLLRLSLKNNPLDAETQSIIDNQGALALLRATEVPPGQRIGTMRLSAASGGSTRSRQARDTLTRRRSRNSLDKDNSEQATTSSAPVLPSTPEALLALPAGRRLSRSISVRPASKSPSRSEGSLRVSDDMDASLQRRHSPLPSTSTMSHDPAMPFSKFKGAFDNLLEEQDFSNKKREALKKLPAQEKWALLTQYKGSTLELLRKGTGGQQGSHLQSLLDRRKTRSKGSESTRTPREYSSLISQRRCTRNDMEALLKLTDVQTESWLSEFVDCGGIASLASLLAYLASKMVKSSSDTAMTVSALKILKHLCEVSLKSVLTTTGSVVAIAANLSTSTTEVYALALDLLDTFCNVHQVGPCMVLQALTRLREEADEEEEDGFDDFSDDDDGESDAAQSLSGDHAESGPSAASARGSERRFVPLLAATEETESGYDLDHVLMCMNIINSILDSTAELETRFEIQVDLMALNIHNRLKKVFQVPGTANNILLQHAQDVFLEDTRLDHDDMLDRYGKSEVLSRMARAFARSSDVTRDEDGAGLSLRVVIYLSGGLQQDVVLSYKDNEPLQRLFGELARRFNLGTLADEYGLFSPSGDLLDLTKTVTELQLTGKQLSGLELRPQPWRVRMRKPDGKETHIRLDPFAMVGELLLTVMEEAGMKDEDPALYSLFCVLRRRSTNTDGGSSTDRPSDSDSDNAAGTSSVAASSSSGNESSSSSSSRSGSRVSRRSTSSHGAETPRRHHEEGIWLDDENKLLVDCVGRSQRKRVCLEVRRRRLSLSVRLADDSTHRILFNPDLLVEQVVETIAKKFLPTIKRSKESGRARDYGLRIEPLSSGAAAATTAAAVPAAAATSSDTTSGTMLAPGQWLDPSLPLSKLVLSEECVLKFALAPRSLDVTVATQAAGAEEAGKSRKLPVLVDFTVPVRELLAKIKQQAGIADSDLVMYQRVHKAELPLDPSVSLRSQTNSTSVRLVVRPRDVNAATSGVVADLNIWCEPKQVGVNVTYNADKEGEIETATLNKLVEHLTSVEDFDLSFMETFLLTYTYFTTGELLLCKLQQRWEVPPEHHESEKVVHLRVFVFCKHWVANEKFPSSVRGAMTAFIKEKLAAEYGDRALALVDELQKAKVGRTTVTQRQPPKSRVPKNISGKLTLFHVDELELARQLSLGLFDAFRLIKPEEFFDQRWAKQKTQHLAPNLMRCIDSFNKVSCWVSSALVSEPHVRQRAKLLAKFISIGDHLRQLNNFHHLTALISGINNSAVSRLKWTRARLSNKSLQTLESLEELMSMGASFSNYRRQLQKCLPPAIPYLGVYLTDLTFIGDGNPDMLPGQRINFVKHRYVWNIVSTVEKFQTEGYVFNRVEVIHAFLKEQACLSEKDLYDLSLKREPRGAARGDIE